MNTDITYCASTNCRHFSRCRCALDDQRVEAIRDGNGYARFSVSGLMRDDGTCEAGECE